ncbi:MAG: phosphate regulon transcriptional regulator PhoB [Alphaproteobacteria bacterium]
MKKSVLIIEDESALVTMLSYNLEKEDYTVISAGDGEKGITMAVAQKPSIILLDWMLPGISGIDVCRKLRQRNETKDIPIIMLTARGEEADKVKGLSVGADDYMTKPLSVPELLARITSVLRRTQNVAQKGELVFDDIVMDLTTHRVTRGSRYIHLGPTEFRLLQYLMERPGVVFSREELLTYVWGADIHVEIRTVDVHVRRLRKSLNEKGEADVIRTVRATGYSIDHDAVSNSDEGFDDDEVIEDAAD